jgi:hypothetical protein
MARDKKQRARDNRRRIRTAISAAVSQAFPGCTADFCGGVEFSRMAKLGEATLGFRIKDARGKHRSNIIWINTEYEGEWTAEWVAEAVKRSNG